MRVRVGLIWLLTGALLLAGGALRLGGLDRLPLTPTEAASALHAAEAVDRGSPFAIATDDPRSDHAPFYTNATGGFMGTMGVSSAVARLLPAIAAALLLVVPLLLLEQLGPWTAMATIGLIIISPTAQAVARTASGQSPAILGLVLALALLARDQGRSRAARIVAGLSLGLGAAAGPSFWMGVFGLSLGFMSSGLWRGGKSGGPLAELRDWERSWEILLVAAAAFLLAAGWFGTRLEGIGEGVAAPGVWLAGWVGPGGFPLLTGVALIPIYELLPLAAGSASLLRGVDRSDPFLRGLLFWALGALAAYLVYPGRTPADLLWFVVPASVLAAHFLVWLLGSIATLEVPYTALSLAALVLSILLFAYIQLEAAGSGLGLASLERGGQVGFAAAGLMFVVAIVVLFGIGWSWREAGLALGLALTVALSSVSISFAWRLTLDRTAASGQELWRPAASTQSLELLDETLEAVAVAEVGREAGLMIEVRDQVPANLAWILRDHRPAASMAEAGPPAVILAPEGGEPELPAEYLGQVFGISEHWNWIGLLPPDMLAWWLDRRAPTARERWVLYVRTDVAGLGEALNPVDEE